MRKLFALLLVCPSFYACDEVPSADRDADFRDADSKPGSDSQEAAELAEDSKPGFVMTCAEVLDPGIAGQLPWLESVEPGVAQFPQLGFSCEEMLETPPNNDVSHGQAVCSWKVADAIGMELDALEFALWENDAGETVCGCRCPRCQAGDPVPQTYDEIGEGTMAAPFEIYNKEQLSDLGMNPTGWDANYLQCDDIDLEPYYDDGGALFSIGEENGWQTAPFTGSYDGDEWEIAGFVGGTVWPQDFVALFGHIEQASLSNIAVVDPSGVRAGLVYRAEDSSLQNISVGGGSAGQGGIVGLMLGGTFDGGRANIQVSGGTAGGAFGVIGGDAVVENVAAYGNVNGYGSGGLASSVSATVINCEAHGHVDAAGFAGGLVGRLQGGGLISRSFATGDATSDVAAGGLVGTLGIGGTIEWSYATGDAWATNLDNSGAGGLVGRASTDAIDEAFSVTNSYALGNATGGAASGLVTGAFYDWIEPGTPGASIQFCYASGDATATGATNPTGDIASYAGGLTAFMPGFNPFISPPIIGQSFTTGVPTSNDDATFAYMVGVTAGNAGVAFNIEAQTGNQNGQGTAASLANGDFQNPTLPPLNLNWVEGPNAWDFSEALPTIPSAGAN